MPTQYGRRTISYRTFVNHHLLDIVALSKHDVITVTSTYMMQTDRQTDRRTDDISMPMQYLLDVVALSKHYVITVRAVNIDVNLSNVR